MEYTAQPSPLKTPLTDLRGIGPAKANRIQQALQIDFAEGLVGLDSEDIFHRLAETGPQIPRREIQQWLIQALRLVKAHEAETPAVLAETPESGGSEPSDREALDSGPNAHAEEIPSGAFEIIRVGPCLKIQHMAAGFPSAELTTADPQTLYEWIETQLPPSLTGSAAPAPESLPQWRIEITKVEISPLEQNRAIPASQSQDYLAQGVPFVVGVDFQVTGEAGQLQASPTRAMAQFSMRNRLTGEVVSLGTAQGHIHRMDVAHLQSPPATLNSPGIYQLQAVITLQDQEAVAGYRELQLVKVL